MRPLLESRFRSYFGAVAMPALLALMVLALKWPRQAWPAWATLYLLVVVGLAVIYGWPQAVVSLVAGALLLDYFFVGAADDLSIPDPVDRGTFVAFVLVGLLAAAAIGCRRAREARLRAALALAQAQADLLQSRASADVLSLTMQHELVMNRANDQATRLSDEVAASAARISGLGGATDGPAGQELRQEAARLESLARELQKVSRRLSDSDELAS